MVNLAVFLQEPDLAATNHWIMIFTGLVAVALVSQAIAFIALAVKASGAIKSVLATVETFKGKAMPLIASSSETVETVQSILRENAPKVRIVTDNVVHTSNIVRSTAEQFAHTAADANYRAHNQVTRVDGMVSAALTTTSEVIESINHGIKVPAQKIALMATQAKVLAEGLMAKVRTMSANMPFGNRN